MKFIVEQSLGQDEVEITVRCGLIDERLQRLIEQIRLYGFSLMGKREGASYVLHLEGIDYFESVEERTYAYTQDGVYECAPRLYELERQLGGTDFVRVSKACLLNTGRVDSVWPCLDGKLEALLENGERVLVNRHYFKGFKEKFGL